MSTDAPALDPKRLADLRDLGGPEMPELADEVARIFVTTAQEGVGELGSAFKRGSVPDALHHAHRLKGSAGNVGALILMKLCDEIEQQARAGQIAPPAQMTAVEAEFARVLKALEAEFVLEE